MVSIAVRDRNQETLLDIQAKTRNLVRRFGNIGQNLKQVYQNMTSRAVSALAFHPVSTDMKRLPVDGVDGSDSEED